MNDALLEEIAQVAREEGARDADTRWERLAAGELSAAEDARLREEAARDPHVAALYEAYRPLGAEVVDRITRRVAKASPVVRSENRFWRRASVAVVPLALAASVALWLGVGRPERRDGARSLPAYSLVVSGDRSERSAPDAKSAIEASRQTATIELRPESVLSAVLRPAQATSLDVVVHSFVVQGEEVREWAPRVERSADGALRVTGRATEIFAGASGGEWDVVFVVERASAAPPSRETLLASVRDPKPEPGWQSLMTHIRLSNGG